MNKAGLGAGGHVCGGSYLQVPTFVMSTLECKTCSNESSHFDWLRMKFTCSHAHNGAAIARADPPACLSAKFPTHFECPID